VGNSVSSRSNFAKLARALGKVRFVARVAQIAARTEDRATGPNHLNYQGKFGRGLQKRLRSAYLLF